MTVLMTDCVDDDWADDHMDVLMMAVLMTDCVGDGCVDE